MTRTGTRTGRVATMRRKALVTLVAAGTAVAALAANAGSAVADDEHDDLVRFATYNASLNRGTEGRLIADLSAPSDAQASAVAEVIQRLAPDVVLINEFDYDDGHVALRLFQDNYLSRSHNGSTPIEYPYRYTAPSNTGVPSGYDLDNDGTVGGGNDALGFGQFPGQFGMAVYSRYPIEEHRIRTFQNFRWRDMPGARLPDDPATSAPADWYGADELAVLPLSSKSHWDIPIDVGGERVHFLVSHPTPPVFDGPEDRNGLRNADEIRFWADYVAKGRDARYIYDDEGRRGGLRGSRFVIAGDQNSDPFDGDSVDGAIQQLLDHRRIDADLIPESEGAVEQATLQGGANATQLGDPRYDTADFADTTPGNLRVDYVLPSRRLDVVDGGVFWPLSTDPLFRLVGVFPFPTSDHKPVWLDVRVD
ncbi:MAG: endonuclease/exonuclease/phosphatase family protein [Kineosporiaceae bacterium]